MIARIPQAAGFEAGRESLFPARDVSYRVRSMSAAVVDLGRFALEGILGEGAELQVFAATDTDTGRRVAVKRPHPTLIERSQHGDIEQRLQRIMSLREDMGDRIPHLPRLIGYAPSGKYDDYFGDLVGQSYMVTIEERARGLPLVGSVVDGIRGSAIGLPQNLFALHPLVPHSTMGAFSIIRHILDVAEAFYDAGVLLLDLGPQNVFFDAKSASITVIDVGSLTVERPATRRHAAVDLHDFYVEIFKWYTSPASPPGDVSDYGEPHGMGSVLIFDRNLSTLRAEFSIVKGDRFNEVAVGILEKVRQRGYRSFTEFRLDFDGFLGLAEERYSSYAQSNDLVSVWRDALQTLNDPYWSKYLFDPAADLSPYSAM